MEIKTVWSVYFSATGTTEKVVTTLAKTVAQELGAAYQAFSFNLPKSREDELSFGPDDLVVMGVPVYAGMVVGETPKQEDISVNICKKKQLTNMRASGSDDALRLTPPKQMSLEQCLEFLADDELLEVTPKSLRMRKAILNHEQRMKSLKGKK